MIYPQLSMPNKYCKIFYTPCKTFNVQCLMLNLHHSMYTGLVSHTPNQTELRTLSNVEQGAQHQVKYYQCPQQGLVWVMGHSHYTITGILY